MEPAVKADPESTWVKLKLLGPVIAITAAAVVLYMKIEHAITDIHSTMRRDASEHAADRVAIVKSVDGVRDELRKVFVDSVATRQAQTWIEMFRALNKEKLPGLIVPDLPR
jgi:hypothetical protein